MASGWEWEVCGTPQTEYIPWSIYIVFFSSQAIYVECYCKNWDDRPKRIERESIFLKAIYHSNRGMLSKATYSPFLKLYGKNLPFFFCSWWFVFRSNFVWLKWMGFFVLQALCRRKGRNFSKTRRIRMGGWLRNLHGHLELEFNMCRLVQFKPAACRGKICWNLTSGTYKEEK